MKSNDNGTTWTKTIVLDFPVDINCKINNQSKGKHSKQPQA